MWRCTHGYCGARVGETHRSRRHAPSDQLPVTREQRALPLSRFRGARRPRRLRNEAQRKESAAAMIPMQRRLALVALIVGLPLVFAGPALAGYWFFKGYLPLSDGTRTVFLGSRPIPPVYIRSSWAPCTHNMKGVMIRTDYTWEGVIFNYANGCDQHFMDQFPEAHLDYGCQNPGGDAQVWDNCYAGTNY